MRGLSFSVGHLEKSPIERIRSQAGADAGMSLICCVPLKLKFSWCPVGYERVKVFDKKAYYQFFLPKSGEFFMAGVSCENKTNSTVVVSRAGGHAGNSSIAPGDTLEWYVQVDRSFFIQPDLNQLKITGKTSYVVTKDVEYYAVNSTADGSISLVFLGAWGGGFASNAVAAANPGTPAFLSFSVEQNEERFANDEKK